MTERGILFTPENYDKCADGSKTQTRRIMKPQPPDWVKVFGYTCFTPKGSISGRGTYEDKGPAEKFFKCPFGTVGDRLYVKEGLARHGSICKYRRDNKVISPACLWQWKKDSISSMFMPKCAARLWLEIIQVRVERLHDISETDAIAEGCCDAYGPDFHVGALKRLWESNKIHKPGSWEINPWVWVISFRKVEP